MLVPHSSLWDSKSLRSYRGAPASHCLSQWKACSVEVATPALSLCSWCGWFILKLLSVPSHTTQTQRAAVAPTWHRPVLQDVLMAMQSRHRARLLLSRQLLAPSRRGLRLRVLLLWVSPLLLHKHDCFGAAPGEELFLFLSL